MGISMALDVQGLVKRVDGVEVITKPFEKEEMDLIVKRMLVDRAPGPDGFNGLFLKKCCHNVKEDFYRLAQDFHSGATGLTSINSSYITLVPKSASPQVVNDYRPISLTNVCLKFLTKLVENRL